VQALAWSWPGIGQRTRLSLVAPGEVGVGFATFVARWGSVTSPVLVGAVLLSAAVAAGLYFRRPDELRRRLLLLAVAPLAAALVEAAVLGSIRWFHLWGLAARYVSVGILLVCLQPALWLSGLVESATQGAVWSRRRPRLAPLLCTLAALAGLVARFGLPSPAGARRVLDTQMNRSIADAALAANAAGCSHLLGDWWEVFPVALSANILRTERGGTAPPIWPLSLSSRMMRAKWEVPDWSRARVCVLANDGKWRAMAEHVGLAIADDEGERGARPIFLAAGVGERGSGATGPRL
jgi:hypothetical protein